MQHDNDNNIPVTPTRPASFDQLILQWRPLLHKLAAQMEPNASEREDLVQDTIASALASWASYDDSKKMSGWLAWRMRGVIANRRRQVNLLAAPLDRRAFVEPTQEHAAMLASVLRIMPATGRSNQTPEQVASADKIVLRIALGDTQEEIAQEQGCARQNVQQVLHARQRRLRQHFGWVAA